MSRNIWEEMSYNKYAERNPQNEIELDFYELESSEQSSVYRYGIYEDYSPCAFDVEKVFNEWEE